MINLYLGDCLDIIPKLKLNSVDLIICDLPYGTTSCKWDSLISLEKLWDCYNKVLKKSGKVLLFGIEPFSSQLRMSNLKDYRYDLYWHKTLCSNFMMGKSQPFFKIETISVFYKESGTYNPIMREGKPYTIKESHILQQGMQQKYNIKYKSDIENNGQRYPDNLLDFGSVGGKKKHLTQKPIDLLEYLVKTYSNENDLILDNCMGSGSTGIACKNLNRDFIGIEKDVDYFKLAKESLLNE